MCYHYFKISEWDHHHWARLCERFEWLDWSRFARLFLKYINIPKSHLLMVVTPTHVLPKSVHYKVKCHRTILRPFVVKVSDMRTRNFYLQKNEHTIHLKKMINNNLAKIWQCFAANRTSSINLFLSLFDHHIRTNPHTVFHG